MLGHRLIEHAAISLFADVRSFLTNDYMAFIIFHVTFTSVG